MNAEKMAEEGEFSAEQLIWGLHMNFSAKTTRPPDAKCVKAKCLLALPELAPGCRRVPVRLVQELMGVSALLVRGATSHQAGAASLGQAARQDVRERGLG